MLIHEVNWRPGVVLDGYGCLRDAQKKGDAGMLPSWNGMTA